MASFWKKNKPYEPLSSYCLLSSFFLALEDYSRATLQVLLMSLTSTKFDKIKPKWSLDISLQTCMLHSSWLTPQWPWRQPKMVNSGSLELSDLTVYDAYFEPTVRIFSNQIKGQKFFPMKIRLPSYIPYK